MDYLSDYTETVRLIYDAGLDFSRWPAVLERLADSLGASVACLVRHNAVTAEGAMIMVRSDPSFAQLYAEHYARLNVIAQRVGNRPAETCITDRMVIPREELRSTEFYSGFMRPQNADTLLNIFLLSQGEHGTRIALARSRSDGDWEQHHIKCARLLAPHLHRAAQVNRRLETTRIDEGICADALNLLSDGVIVVDAESSPIFVNSAAHSLLARSDGLSLTSKGLSTADRSQTAHLRRAIAGAASRRDEPVSGDALRVTRPSLGRAFSLFIVPLKTKPTWFDQSRSAAIVFIGDPDRTVQVPVSYLRQLYGLTSTEAALTMRVSSGSGLRAAADAMNITLSTARTHLQRVFQKTQTHRQAELARLLTGIWAGLTLDRARAASSEDRARFGKISAARTARMPRG